MLFYILSISKFHRLASNFEWRCPGGNIKVENKQYGIYKNMVRMGMVGGKFGSKLKHVHTCTVKIERLCL